MASASCQHERHRLSQDCKISTPYSGPQLTSQLPLTYANVGARRSNHWLGTAKIGTDSGLKGGTSVVDLNTKVYGTDNIFVVDASIFPGMPSTNPSALIVVAAEKASEKILALPPPKGVPHFGQCGGLNYDGDAVCVAGTTCTYANSYYSQVCSFSLLFSLLCRDRMLTGFS
jgi:cellobiose dehydrogenase (acceptor)